MGMGQVLLFGIRIDQFVPGRHTRFSMGNSTNTEGLQGAWEKIKGEAHDLLSIDVTTFSAPNVTLDVQDGGPFNLDKLFEQIKAKVGTGSTLNLVAHTHVDFDLDAVMIAKEDGSPGLMEAHNKAVQTAIEARQSFVKALKGMFG